MISIIGEELLLPGVFSLIVLWVARSFGFFKLLPGTSSQDLPRITFWQLATIFAIYLVCSLFMPLIVIQFLVHFFPHFGQPEFSTTSAVTPLRLAYSQMGTLIVSAVALFTFCFLQKDRASMLAILKRPLAAPTSIRRDFVMGIVAWAVSFPVINFIGTAADFLINLLFGEQQYEQVAVRYLKSSLGSEFPLILALITIVLVAPILEELLFRGFLQNFFKRFLGVKAAILLAGFTFALFHFSFSQNLGNVPLVASLFVLALFLGFIYERQQSLFASIGLHMTFNTISVLRILFMQEG